MAERPRDRTVIITQARTGSTRLPGKVLKTVSGKSLLEFHIARLLCSRESDAVVVATTVRPADDPIAELCGKLGVPVFRGDENDVLDRYLGAASAHGAETVVRVTSDCPLVDPAVVDAVIAHYRRHPGLAYVHNSPDDDALRTYPRGMDAEVFSFASLREAHGNARDPVEREHVTPYLRRRPDRFPAGLVDYPERRGGVRLCVDTAEDFELIRRILEHLYPTVPEFGIRDVFRVLDEQTDWLKLNSAVVQKRA